MRQKSNEAQGYCRGGFEITPDWDLNYMCSSYKCAAFVSPWRRQHGGVTHCSAYKQSVHHWVCNSAHTDRTERDSDESQPARQAAAFMRYQRVTKYSVVITTLRDVNYHNSERIISSSLNNISSRKTEESATKIQSDQRTIRYQKFSAYMSFQWWLAKLFFPSVRNVYPFVQGLHFVTQQQSHYVWSHYSAMWSTDR